MMTLIPPQSGLLQQFYRSGPLPCPYLPGRVERKLFTRMTEPGGAELNSMLSRAGFRRSHDILYRPSCPECVACMPVRVPALAFRPNRTQRRVIRDNADLSLSWGLPQATAEQFALFRAYECSRHSDSDMALMGETDFIAMVGDGSSSTSILEARTQEGRLMAAMLTDRLTDGFSAVYSFFDPELPRRSLGTFLVLALLEHCVQQRGAYVYLGYWIQDSRKMAYKGGFRPLEGLGADGWVRVPDPKSGPVV